MCVFLVLRPDSKVAFFQHFKSFLSWLYKYTYIVHIHAVMTHMYTLNTSPNMTEVYKQYGLNFTITLNMVSSKIFSCREPIYSFMYRQFLLFHKKHNFQFKMVYFIILLYVSPSSYEWRSVCSEDRRNNTCN